MKNPKGIIPIVIIIFIAIIAAGVVGAAWYFQENRTDTNTNDNTNKSTTAECDAPTDYNWKHTPCTNTLLSASEEASIVEDFTPCAVTFSSPETGTMYRVHSGCEPGSGVMVTDMGMDYYNADSELITNCNGFSVAPANKSLCTWLGDFEYTEAGATVNTNINISSNTNVAINSNTNTNTATNTNAPTNTSTSPDMSSLTPNCPTWQTYTDPEYGWTMEYPCNWTYNRTYNASGSDSFVTYPERYVIFTDSTGEYRLLLGIMESGAAGSTINRTGVGAGDFVAQNPITVDGTSVPVRHLVYNNKIKEVFFNQSGPVTIGNYVMTAYFDQDQDLVLYNDIDLTGTNELAIGTAMLESLHLP